MSDKLRSFFWVLVICGVAFTVYSIEHRADIKVPHEPTSSECDAAIETLRQIDDAQLTRSNKAEENEAKQLDSAVRQSEDAYGSEVNREEMQDAARDVARRKEREPAVRRVEEACKSMK
jgi:hypothetical protein